MTDDRTTISRAPISRRTVVTSAAWSIPLIAVAAAAPLAAASVGGADLASTLGTPVDTVFDTGFGPILTFSMPTQLTIANNGTIDSVAGTTATLAYDGWLWALTPSGTGVTASGTAGSLVLTLPAITAGSSLTIDLGVALQPDAAFETSEWVPIYNRDDDATVTVTIAGDDITGNNGEFLVIPVVTN